MQVNTSWLGAPLSQIYRSIPNKFEFDHVDKISPSKDHSVLYRVPNYKKTRPIPFGKGNYHWDQNHVRLPCAPNCVIQVPQRGGGTSDENFWLTVQKSLLKDFNSISELENAIKGYNHRIGRFHALYAFEDQISNEGLRSFLTNLLPKIIRLALRLPDLIKTGIPLLKQDYNHSISLSQEQVSSLLANAFLCTFPRRKSENNNYPDINFNRLFESHGGSRVVEKIKCILNYFNRVCDEPPTGVLTFIRRSFNKNRFPNWSKEDVPLSITPLHLTSVGTIEDQGYGLLQVDFANKFIGGGVLGGGCVQEEIRFVICPELIISRLFTECLKDNEALLMIGAEQFSKYSGYASSFAFNGNYVDSTPLDDSNRRQNHIIAIDAVFFSERFRQYEDYYIKRELNKAYVGFHHPLHSMAPGVATGNWGCGAFGGDSQLKALIQLMACTVTRRPLLYFTFGDTKLRDDTFQIYTFLIENQISVGTLYEYLNEYKSSQKRGENLYDFIMRRHFDKKNPFSFPTETDEQEGVHEEIPKDETSVSSTIKTPQYQNPICEIAEEAEKSLNNFEISSEDNTISNTIVNYHLDTKNIICDEILVPEKTHTQCSNEAGTSNSNLNECNEIIDEKSKTSKTSFTKSNTKDKTTQLLQSNKKQCKQPTLTEINYFLQSPSNK